MTPQKIPDAKTLDRLIQETNRTHQPIPVAGETQNAMLVSEDDWRSIQETLYLISISGMRMIAQLSTMWVRTRKIVKLAQRFVQKRLF